MRGIGQIRGGALNISSKHFPRLSPLPQALPAQVFKIEDAESIDQGLKLEEPN